METTGITPAKTIYGNPDVNEVLETFTRLTNLKLINIKKQRWAATRLLKREGREKVLGMIQIVALIIGDKYAPRVSDIEKLYYKWNDIEIYGRTKVKSSIENPLLDLNTL
jgi:hypothetical protein